MKIAEALLPTAECKKRSVGAVVVKDGSVVGLGVNLYRGNNPGCLSGGCARGENGGSKDYPCIALHAEENAVLNAGREASVGSTVYVTYEPCQNCRRFMSAVGVAQFVVKRADGELSLVVL